MHTLHPRVDELSRERSALQAERVLLVHEQNEIRVSTIRATRIAQITKRLEFIADEHRRVLANR